MPNQKSSETLRHTVGNFASEQTALAAKKELQLAGISPQRISIQTQADDPHPQISETKAADSARGGAIAGGLLGILAGLFLSLNALNSDINLAVITHPQALDVIAPLIGGVVGAAAGSLMGALTGINVPKAQVQSNHESLSHQYLVTVEGTEEELLQVREIFRQQGSQV